MRPDVDDLVVTFVVGDETHVVVTQHFVHLVVRLLDEFSFFFGDQNVTEVEGETTTECRHEPERLDLIEEACYGSHVGLLHDIVDDITQRLFSEQFVDVTCSFRHHLVEQYASNGSFDDCRNHLVTFFGIIHFQFDDGVQVNAFFVERDHHFISRIEGQSFTGYFFFFGGFFCFGQVIQAKHHVLRRHRYREPVGRVQNVVRCKHKELRLENSSVAERNVNSHLVTVKVGIERSTNERVQLDRFTFDKLGLESLDTEAVQRGGTVQENGMSFQDVLENVPHDGLFAINDLLRAFHRLHNSSFDKLADDEWFEKFGCHFFGQTALVQFQFRTYHDHGTCGIVDTLTDRMLAETTLFSFE